MRSKNYFLDFLLDRFKIERERFDRSGVYAYTQRLLAYNSNKIEGSTLTEEQTASLFDNGTLPKSDDYYRAKDVEEMNGHFLMFNKMLDTLDMPLTQELIKKFHYELKSGVFEDRANGYAIGDYKHRPNMIGMYQTVDQKMLHRKCIYLWIGIVIWKEVFLYWPSFTQDTKAFIPFKMGMVGRAD